MKTVPPNESTTAREASRGAAEPRSEIDESMESHLESFVKQCLTQATIKDVPSWSVSRNAFISNEEIRLLDDAFLQALLLPAVRSLLDAITAQDLELLAESKFALLSTAPKRKKGNAGKESEGDNVKLGRTPIDTTSDPHYLAARRRLTTNRITPPKLIAAPDDSTALEPPLQDSPDPQLSLYHLAVDVTEVPLAEISSGSSTLSLTFLANEWRDAGVPTFGKNHGESRDSMASGSALILARIQVSRKRTTSNTSIGSEEHSSSSVRLLSIRNYSRYSSWSPTSPFRSSSKFNFEVIRNACRSWRPNRLRRKKNEWRSE